MNYYGEISQMNNAFEQQAQSKYQLKKTEAEEKVQEQNQVITGITAPLAEGAGMDLIQTGLKKGFSALQKPKEIMNKLELVKSKAQSALTAVKAKIPTLDTSMESLKGKIPDYKVLKKNLRKSIKRGLDKFKGLEEDPNDNPYSPRNFLASMKQDPAKTDGERIANRLKSLQSKKDLGLMSDDQEADFNKLSAKVSKLKKLKITPAADIETISSDAGDMTSKMGIRAAQFRAPVLANTVQPTMEQLNARAQQRLQSLNDNFGTEGNAGNGLAADKSLSVPTPNKPQQDPDYLKQVNKAKADAGGDGKFKLSTQDEGEIAEGGEEAAEGDFNPISDVIGLGISLAGLFGGFDKHKIAVPKAPLTTQGAIQIGANQA